MTKIMCLNTALHLMGAVSSLIAPPSTTSIDDIQDRLEGSVGWGGEIF